MKKHLDLSKKKILITGAHGFLGVHLLNELKKRGATKLYVPTSREADLREIDACKRVVKNMDIVIHLAAKVGGIGYNQKHPAEMYYDNMTMGVNLLHEAYRAHVEKFVALGTICCYPKFTPVPFKEDNLWNGYPEETNAPYGLAKKMMLVQAEAYRKQYGFNTIFLLPVNLYGPGDNFDTESSHVIPSLIRKMVDARNKKAHDVIVWGTGKATREFLYVGEAARAIVLATMRYDKSDPVNIGAGFEISIKSLADKIKHIVGFKGRIVWDKTKPDGQPHRMLDTRKARKEFGFSNKIDFDRALRQTVGWYVRTQS